MKGRSRGGTTGGLRQERGERRGGEVKGWASCGAHKGYDKSSGLGSREARISEHGKKYNLTFGFQVYGWTIMA